MEIQWKPGGGVRILDLSPQEWTWLKQALLSKPPGEPQNTADSFIATLKTAAPLATATGTKPIEIAKEG